MSVSVIKVDKYNQDDLSTFVYPKIKNKYMTASEKTTVDLLFTVLKETEGRTTISKERNFVKMIGKF